MNKFHGWKTVFNFTFKNACGKGYKFITTLIALIIIGVLVLVNILVAKPDEANKPSNIKQVTVLDQSGLTPTDYATLMPQVDLVKFGLTNFTISDANSKEEAAQKLEETTTTGVVVSITAKESGYLMEAIIPSESVISESDCNELLESMSNCFQENKLKQAGLTLEQSTILMKPVVSSYQSVGEDTNIVTILVKILVPMAFGLIMYFLIFIHGQTVSKSVSTEKTSKLMETLLTSIHPYALITGKIFAIASTAILQFLSWIVATIVGLYGGNYIAHSIYPEYENSIVTLISYLRDNIGESALTLPSIIVAILIFCIGFLFYCVLAGMAGCIVSKPEDVASSQGIFIFPVIISWLVCYLSAAAENVAVLKIARFIPFTIPFSVPADLLTGTISIFQGIVSLVILFAVSLLLIMFSARVYKGLVLYNGEKISFQKIIQVVRAKQ